MRYLVGVLMLLLGANSSADEREGFYFLFNLGSSEVEYDVDHMNGLSLAITGAGAVSGRTETKVFSYSAQIGYRLNRNFGLEAGFGSLGESNYTAVTSDLESIDAAASTFFLSVVGVAMYPVVDSVDLFGKAGLAVVHVEEDLSVVGPFFPALSESTSESEAGLTYGAGARWSISDGVMLNLEYNSYDAGSGLGRTSVLSAGFGFSF